MKETKQQVINRLAADNLALREKLSTYVPFEQYNDMHNELLRVNQELAFLRSKLNEADHRARKLIRAHNITRSTEVSERRKAMEAAKARAMATGENVVVGG